MVASLGSCRRCCFFGRSIVDLRRVLLVRPLVVMFRSLLQSASAIFASSNAISVSALTRSS